MATKVVTGKVRLSFPNLFEPRAVQPGQPPKYSTMVLLPKGDTKTLEALHAAEKEAAELGKAKFNGKVPKGLNSIIHDGDVEEGNYDPEDWPERKGHWFFTASAGEQYRPQVVDRATLPVLDRSEVYSGINARVSLNAFAYNTQGNRGVSFGLNNVQILGGGENLGGRKSAQDDFDAVEDDEAEDLL